MRPIRMGALALVAVAAVMFAMAASASAELPEIGRCVKTTGGKYVGKGCVGLAKKKGGYEWAPGPGSKPKFSGQSEEEMVFESVNKRKIICSAVVFEGEFTGPKTETVNVDFIGCNDPATGQPCGSGPNKESEFESKLEGELGYIEGGSKPKVGWDLKAKSGNPDFATFVCVKPPELPELPEVPGAPAAATPAAEVEVPIVGTIEGSAIGRTLKIDKMEVESATTYKASHGVQIPTSFEGGEQDTLTGKFVIGTETFTEQMSFTGKRIDEYEEELEIKAK